MTPPTGERVPGYRFGYVLLLLLVTFVFMASAPTGDWVRPATVLLVGATLVVTLYASRVRGIFLRIAIVVAALGLLAALASMGRDEDVAGGAIALLNVVFIAAAPVAIVSSIWKRRVIDIRTVLGAVCIYVLIGMLWSFAFTAIGAFGSDPFFSEQATASTADYLYFSYVTLTTVGYGDLTAADGLGRSVAVLEALLGQIYLVTVVALLVSNLGGAGKRSHTD